MTLIDSHAFHNFAIAVGTSLFVVILALALWYASRMD
ncbi:delta-aminolevulinic acid dehydratase [Crocosphaera sp. XPORK-15E]|nr:delta-aminolevulinic acid dehydratase [Crocosphaera sp. XPORK-15E]MEA5536262.1 delta-aminolevulinic acid dehydratase [Crocosphaera sp. XPORK-15E]